MKSFKKLLEDVRLMPTEGLRPLEIRSVKGFTVDNLHLLGKPLLSRANLDLYQIHHGPERSGRGHGLFVSTTDIMANHPHVRRVINSIDGRGFNGPGGAFIVHDRERNRFAGVMEYMFDAKEPKELHIQHLRSAEGPHKNIRNMIYDHATDGLGYTLVSDSTHTYAGKRGWEKDIRDGKNIHVRYIRRGFIPMEDQVEEIPAKHVLPIHIWSGKQSTILKPNLKPGGFSTSLYDESDVLLIRRPKSL